MPRRSVKYQKQMKLRGDSSGPVPLEQGIAQIQEMAGAQTDRSYKGGKKRKGVDQTIDLVMHLGIDPKQADQMLRGSLSLPKGIGKTKKVIAFCSDESIRSAAIGSMRVARRAGTRLARSEATVRPTATPAKIRRSRELTPKSREYYSKRSALTGLTRLTRRAGNQVAAIAVTASTAVVPRNVQASKVLTP